MSRIISFFLVLVSVLGGAFDFYAPGESAPFTAQYETGERDMEKYRGVYSCAGDCGGVPTLFVNGEPFPAAAYMTYLEEYNNYSQFAQAGYRLFSVPVLFAGRWISATELFKPFHGGIFDTKGEPDFSTLDASVGRILDACPDAYIFPRVNMSMPQWWIEENPNCTDSSGVRELLFSAEYRETAAGMLAQVIRHINESGYASHIVGYQLAGGNTEEWFHFDLNGGACKNAEKPFREYLQKYYPGCEYKGLPDLSALKGKGPYHKDENLARYLEFANRAVADDICYFASVAKKETGRNVVVGTFYGYTLEVTSPLYGTHALSAVLGSENIDFICSPNSYIDTRHPDRDWTEMYPADSVRLHGKICLQECDIRTHLTKLLSVGAPEYDREANMTAPVWHPLENAALADAAIKKSFGRQLVRGNGFWWFDMWGGWFDDPAILADMKQMREIYARSLKNSNRKSVAEVAVFADADAYRYMTECGLRNTAFDRRRELGNMGAPYDYFDVADFEAVYNNYKAVIFVSCVRTPNMKKALELCKKDGVEYISVSKLKPEFSAKEYRAFCEANGVHIYNRTDDIVYINENYAVIHANSGGEKKIYLDGGCAYAELFCENGLRGEGTVISVAMQAGETKLFEITHRG